MKNLLERIKKGEIFVADGAIGTMLFDYGLKPGEPPESFNLNRPEVLRKSPGSIWMQARMSFRPTPSGHRP
jgi:methionine synthase I (cobalamin-dependent)